ncbi:MAG: beta-lactamase family protein [Roseivirga sp.]|nr:beta-lactamase family protein [Roseivirga sp.]
MKTRSNLSELIWLLALIIVTQSCADDDQPTEALTLPEQIDQYLADHQSTDSPGLSIAIRQAGQTVYQNNRGLARESGQRVIDSDTQFRVGSITKPITAIAIMQLLEQGEIGLNNKLLSFYPELPAAFEAITVEHLLTHRSGLLDYIDDNTDLSALDNVQTSTVLGFFDDTGLENLNFVPGTAGDYSNTGYVLLALIIEKVSGMSYPDYLRQNLFNPTGMTRSFVISEHQHLGDAGNNYALSFGNSLKVKGFNSLIYGASGVASTTNDLLLFMEALLSNELISQESLDLMIPSRGAIPGIADYGLGWMTGTGQYWHSADLTDNNDFWHSGGFDGYRTVLSFNPDLDLQVVILTNGGDATQEIMWGLLKLVRNHYKQ